MGCVSSKLFRKELNQELFGNGDYAHHVVSLTSTTYGLLSLDKKEQTQIVSKEIVTTETKKSPPREQPQVINAWELMEDLDEGLPISNKAKKSPKSPALFRNFKDFDLKSPSKKTPKKQILGKENKQRFNVFNGEAGWSDCSPKRVLKEYNLSNNCNKAVPPLTLDSERVFKKKSLTPVFDPELIASLEKKITEDEEQIKKMVPPTPRIPKWKISGESNSILELFDKKCPPGGENAVVIYTTTLRGIRRTFEDCNNVRSIIDSYQIHVFERDISMDSGFKEELRGLIGKKEIRVPVVFVKGRLIGGAEELMKLEEEGKLGHLFEDIPRAIGWCEGCAGVRFMMCMECNGSCKVLDAERKKMVRCGECNENGLIQCPICC